MVLGDSWSIKDLDPLPDEIHVSGLDSLLIHVHHICCISKEFRDGRFSLNLTSAIV